MFETRRTITCDSSLSTDGDALDWLNAARAAWERTSDQLTIDLESSDPPGDSSNIAPAEPHSAVPVRAASHGGGSDSACATTSPGPYPKSGPTASPATNIGVPQHATHREGRAQDPNTNGDRRKSASRRSAAVARKDGSK